MEELQIRKRPQVVPSITIKRSCGCGSLYTIITYLEDGPLEVFAYLGKAGRCETGQMEAITRGVTQGLRFGIPLSVYVKQLSNIRCERQMPPSQEGASLSCSDTLSRSLDLFLTYYWPEIKKMSTAYWNKTNLLSEDSLG